MDEQLEQIEGVVEDIIYENEDNGYVVFEISGGGVLTVVCGIVGELHAGESVICRGRYENHATYGRQFHAQECETDMPKDLEAVYAFLASRSLPYIGAKTADKIIDMFGAEALEVIANDPARLTKIPGISPDKADRIQQEFKRMFGMRELIAYLAQFEISPRKAMEVFKAFGVGAMQAIASNPYLLCGEPLQLDFRHADSIAQYYHLEGDCAQRLEAALLRTLRHNAGNGHTCLPRAQLLTTASNFIHQPPEKLARALDRCIETEELAVKMFDAVPYIYLPDLLSAEQDIADRLNLLAKRGKNTVRELDKNIQILELTQGFAYAPPAKGSHPQGYDGELPCAHRRPRHRQDHHRQRHFAAAGKSGRAGGAVCPHRPRRQAAQRADRAQGQHHPPSVGGGLHRRRGQLYPQRQKPAQV